MLTLLLPQVSLEGPEDSLETQAVVTTHRFSGLGFAGGPHQRYEFVAKGDRPPGRLGAG